MGRGVEGVAGGICGLRRLLADPETAGAIQADLLRQGLNLVDLGTWKLSYWDLLCSFRWSLPDSAVMRLRHPESWQWTLIEQLLAGIYDALQGGNWQRGGNPHAPRPKPLPRPGIDAAKDKNTQVVKDPNQVSVPATEIKGELARRRALYAQAAVPEPAQIPEPVRPRRRGRFNGDEVRMIRQLVAAGPGAEDLAGAYGVSVTTIERLVARETYRNVE